MAQRTEIDPQKMLDDGRLDHGADYHLKNWARWMRRYEVGKGYDHKSTVITGYGSSTFDDMLEFKDRQDAKIANACIDSLSKLHQCAIHNVYLADVWRFRGDPVEMFIEAAREFWSKAQCRGLV